MKRLAKMRAILFCQNPYAFGILQPLCEELAFSGHPYLWYLPGPIESDFPYIDRYQFTDSIRQLIDFKPDAIFVPGNEVPYYLPGVKVQIFHGFAGEKKGHFRIRHYFDLYLTQGPYFTERFNILADKYCNFSVVQTGWCKLDPLFKSDSKRDVKPINRELVNVLYAPTFSPSFTSVRKVYDQISTLANNSRFRVVIKFHDLTSIDIVEKYRLLAENVPHLEVSSEKNILQLMLDSDLLISDTSSVVYEYLLLDKPVITIGSRSPHINWTNIEDPNLLFSAAEEILNSDPYSEKRRWFFESYHPYDDGKSSGRMIDATLNYIELNGVPDSRRLSALRRMKINRLFGTKPHA